MAGQNATEISEQLFQAIDTIVAERIRTLQYDKTVVATIVDNSSAAYGKYYVTTDDNITFVAYGEVTTYPVKERVYIRIPGNDYTKQKVIIGRYIQENRSTTISENKSNNLESLRSLIKKLSDRLTILEEKKE